MNKINWNWPRTKNNHFFPWYIILKNIVILPLLFLGGSIMLTGQLIKFLGGLICYLYLCLADSPKGANIWWNREMGV